MRRSSSHHQKKGPGKSSASVVMRLIVVCALFITISVVLARDVIVHGADMSVRSRSVKELQLTGNRLLKENHDLRSQKAFLETPRGKEIIARRNLFKNQGEKYAIISSEGKD